MKGIDQLIRLRMTGKKPETVFINFDAAFKQPKILQEWKYINLEYRPTKDLRAFVGLDVIITANRYTIELAKLYEALQEYAQTISVLICEMDEDLGWWWSKETGQKAYGERV